MFYNIVNLNMKQLDKTLKAGIVVLIILSGLTSSLLPDLEHPFTYVLKAGIIAGICVAIAIIIAAVRRVFYVEMFTEEAYLYMSFPVSIGCYIWGKLVALLLTASPILLLVLVLAQAVSGEFWLIKLVGRLVLESAAPLAIGSILSLGAIDAIAILAKVFMIALLAIFFTQKLKAERRRFIVSVLIFVVLVLLAVGESVGQLFIWNSIIPKLSWSIWAVAADTIFNTVQVWLLVKLCTWFLEAKYELK